MGQQERAFVTEDATFPGLEHDLRAARGLVASLVEVTHVAAGSESTVAMLVRSGHTLCLRRAGEVTSHLDGPNVDAAAAVIARGCDDAVAVAAAALLGEGVVDHTIVYDHSGRAIGLVAVAMQRGGAAERTRRVLARAAGSLAAWSEADGPELSAGAQLLDHLAHPAFALAGDIVVAVNRPFALMLGYADPDALTGFTTNSFVPGLPRTPFTQSTMLFQCADHRWIRLRASEQILMLHGRRRRAVVVEDNGTTCLRRAIASAVARRYATLRRVVRISIEHMATATVALDTNILEQLIELALLDAVSVLDPEAITQNRIRICAGTSAKTGATYIEIRADGAVVHQGEHVGAVVCASKLADLGGALQVEQAVGRRVLRMHLPRATS